MPHLKTAFSAIKLFKKYFKRGSRLNEAIYLNVN